MTMPANDVVFGRRRVPPSPLSGFSEPEAVLASPSEASNPIFRVLERVFLWLPNDRSPGFWAICLVLLRQATLPIVLMTPALLFIFSKMASNARSVGETLSAPNGLTSDLVALCVFGCLALVQELSRYAFVRHAEKPLRAVLKFTGVAASSILAIYHDSPYACAWMIALQVTGSVAIIYGLRYRRHIPIVILTIIIGQTGLGVTARQLFSPQNAATSTTTHQIYIPPVVGQSSAPVAANTSPDPAAPPVAAMQPWAKIYPGATVTTNKTDHLLGTTTWRVNYTVQASPENIAAFYEAAATKNGFNTKRVLVGLHSFRQDSTANDFQYMIFTGPDGSNVYFQARIFGQTGS